MNQFALNNIEPVALPLAEACLREVVDCIRDRWDGTPTWGMVLGTGSGAVADALEPEAMIPFAELPHFPHCTAIGHAGNLICGRWLGRPIVALQGRFHLYEGHSAAAVTFPIRVLQQLGIRRLLLSNAAGGVHPEFKVGDLMLVDDTIDVFFRRGVQPAQQPFAEDVFPDRAAAGRTERCGRLLLDRHLLTIAERSAQARSIRARRGVYVGLLGPNYETAAEYRMVRWIGGDAVGMSTIPELVTAYHCGLSSMTVSIITNVANPELLQKTTGPAVVAAGNSAADQLRQLWADVITEADRQ